MANSSVTPSRQQYLDVKAQHPDAIVFFRLGDFYETFDADAEVAARELDLVLTSRPQGKGIRTPMAGVPSPRRRRLHRPPHRQRLQGGPVRTDQRNAGEWPDAPRSGARFHGRDGD
jgi:hypothetical protein